MKQITLKTLLVTVATLFVFNNSLLAQKREKAERIIIERKPGKSEKTIIEIDGNKIKVNGKEVKNGDSNIIIRELEDKEVFLRMPRYHFKYPEHREHEFRNMQQNYERMGKLYQLHNGELQRKMQDVQERIEKRAFLGVSTDEVEKGLKITEVQKESAAASAGLQEGDIITKVDGADMKESEQLIEAIRKHKPGDEVSIEYLRDGKKKTTKAVLKSIKMVKEFNFNTKPMEIPRFNFEGLRELELLAPFDHFNSDGDYSFSFKRGPKLGTTVQDTEDEKGVTVEQVDADSPAAKSGIQKGDLITEINGNKIKNVADAREAMSENADKTRWTVQVLRGGKPLNIEVKFPKELRKTELKP